jgi:hypothetical protein
MDCLLTGTQDKETSKFALVLQQTLDSMASNEAWIKVRDSSPFSLDIHPPVVPAIHRRRREMAQRVAGVSSTSCRVYLYSVTRFYRQRTPFDVNLLSR